VRDDALAVARCRRRCWTNRPTFQQVVVFGSHR
jgi:hypothetical protein